MWSVQCTVWNLHAKVQFFARHQNISCDRVFVILYFYKIDLNYISYFSKVATIYSLSKFWVYWLFFFSFRSRKFRYNIYDTELNYFITTSAEDFVIILSVVRYCLHWYLGTPRNKSLFIASYLYVRTQLTPYKLRHQLMSNSIW